MKLKKLIGAIALVGIMAFTTACGNTEKTSSNTEGTEVIEGEKNIGLSVSTLNNPFFVSLVDGAKAKAEENGINLIVVDARDDVAKQTSDIEDLISKQIDVLIVNPVDSDAVAPAVEEAKSNDISVISVDRVVNGVDVDCAISSDNVAGGEMATEYLLELLGEGAKVAEIEGISGASATIERGEGFHNIADEKLEVVSEQSANFNRSEGLTVMENIMQANPDVKGVFAHNDEMALGAIEAVNGSDILVVGFDATDDGVAAVKEGKMAATVAQKPDMMGEIAVEVANKILSGEEVEKEIHVEVELIKAE